MATSIDNSAQIAQLQLEIAALQSAIFSGVLRSSYDGKSVEYDDFQSMKLRLSFAQDLLNQLQNPGYRKPQAGYVHYKGYPRRPIFGGLGTYRIF